MNSKQKVALKLSGLTPESKVTKAQGILDAMQASGNFPASDMPISYTKLQSAIDNLHNAILATNSGTPLATSAMHDAERVLINYFNVIKAHVEMLANSLPDAVSVILSAGMQVVVNGGPNAVSELTLEAAGAGNVVVRVPRGKDEKAFVFEISTDGTNFSKLRSSTLTKITIGGYAPGSTISMRYYAIVKTGDTPVSAAKSIMVV